MTELNRAKISVIMPNYNCEQYVGNAIKSVLSQTYEDFELIIVDDCSTDSSRDVIDSFQDTRIKKVFFEENEHMYYAYNYAIGIADGKYYAIIDSDDYWHPDKLKKQVEYMEEHLECGACFTLVNVVDEDDNILTEYDTDRVKLFEVKNQSRREWIRYFYFRGGCLCHTSAFIRREVINKVGIYNYSLVQIADFELWTRIVKKYDIYVLQEKLATYRWFRSGKNFSAPSDTVNIRSTSEFAFVMSRYFDDISDELLVEVFLNDFINRDAKSHEELMCERALMLLRTGISGNPGKIGGIIKLADLIQQDSTRKLLREKYGITHKKIYEFTMTPILYDSTIAAKVQHVDEQQKYISQLEDGHKHQQEYIDNLERDLKSQNEYAQELENKQKSQQGYIGNLERNLKSQNEYVQGLEERQKNQQKYIGNLERDLKSQNEYAQELENKQKSQQEYIDNLERDLKSQNEYVQEVEEKQNNQQEYIDNLERDLKNQNEYVQTLIRTVNQQEEHLKQKEGENSTLKLQIKDKEKEVSKLEEVNIGYLTSIQNFEETLSVQNRHITNLENKIQKYIDSHKRR